MKPAIRMNKIRDAHSIIANLFGNMAESRCPMALGLAPDCKPALVILSDSLEDAAESIFSALGLSAQGMHQSTLNSVQDHLEGMLERYVTPIWWDYSTDLGNQWEPDGGLDSINAALEMLDPEPEIGDNEIVTYILR